MTKIIACPYCGSLDVIKYGKFEGIKRLWGNACKRKFTEVDKPPYMKTPKKVVSSTILLFLICSVIAFGGGLIAVSVTDSNLQLNVALASCWLGFLLILLGVLMVGSLLITIVLSESNDKYNKKYQPPLNVIMVHNLICNLLERLTRELRKFNRNVKRLTNQD